MHSFTFIPVTHLTSVVLTCTYTVHVITLPPHALLLIPFDFKPQSPAMTSVPE